MRKIMAYGFAFIVLAGAMSAAVRAADNVSETKSTKNYTITLKVLPAGPFNGKDAKMVRDGGAAPLSMMSSPPPNFRLVVFIEKDGKPVVDAKVQMSYSASRKGSMITMRLPAVRMHEAGKGPETTHFGNNVILKPGEYQVNVTVNGTDHAVFRFKV
jgi:hypothetical protein